MPTFKQLGLALLGPSIVSAGPLNRNIAKRDGSDYKDNAVCTADQLMRNYQVHDTGLWGKDLWWQSGNFMSALATLTSLNSDYLSEHGDVFVNTYDTATGYGNYVNFLDAFYDDEGWWGNAWLDVYDVTQNQTYLDAAITIYNDIIGGLGTPCGGIWWDKNQSYVAAISNGLYIELAAGIAARVGSDQASDYLSHAVDGWNWFFSVGLVGNDSMVSDGVDKGNNCAPVGAKFTYNQGVILGAAAELYKATNNQTYLEQAAALANASSAAGSSVTDSNGILHDGCDESDNCDETAEMFKGPYMRGLRKLQLAYPHDNWKNFIITNAQSIWNNDLYFEQTDSGSVCNVGEDWAGPYNSTNEVTQGAALDALNAALAVTQ
ncbi:glycoside hydrolase [Talaromyces proteolyticus]|uniref:Glycoside hydrolase n=1 Tax=Talaromyces proteolyticus TaxID=1131652 RepID=A0AAD4PVI6_9EURO|nr:glycoside hydrolase [Talaromyces proteolyticus]KAH8693562.1 glycoside hydrolase [Talaromyces proteolyticus]